MLLLNVGLFVYQAFVIMLEWNWFMPNLFKLPVLNLGQALGLCIIYTCLAYTSSNNKESEDEIKRIIISLLSISLWLPLGYIVYLWV